MKRPLTASVAATVYCAAILRHGKEAAAIGRREAMEAVLSQTVEAAADQVEREATLTEA